MQKGAVMGCEGSIGIDTYIDVLELVDVLIKLVRKRFEPSCSVGISRMGSMG